MMVEQNVLEMELQPCSRDPVTGFVRDGFCRYMKQDRGRHQICAVVTEEFLEFSKRRGNDLMTARPDMNFPGLDPGDRWCLCVGRWIEAHEAGCAPPVVLEATTKAVLDTVPLHVLRNYEYEG